MKKEIIMLLLIIGFTSCQFFETEKISSETFLNEEINSINWKDVDQYPVFTECEHFTEKLEQKKCFETTVTSRLYKSILSENMLVTRDMHDTLLLEVTVNEKGKLSIVNIVADSVLTAQLPLLEINIKRSIDSLQPIAPAYKRGIPVRTTFILPIVIKTD